MVKIGKINPDKCFFFCGDLQEIFKDKIKDFQAIVSTASIMMKVAEMFQIPVLISEQNPVKLGKTVHEIEKNIPSSHCKVIAKLTYSMVNEESQKFIDLYLNCKIAVVFGVQTHICIQQTCEDLIHQDFQVYVLLDGTDSIRKIDKRASIYKLQSIGVKFTTLESLVYELTKNYTHPNMKKILPLMKIERKYQSKL